MSRPGVAKIRTGDIAVEGLAQLSRALKNLSPEQAKELRKANKDAAEIAADAARTKAMQLGGVAAKVAPTISARGGVRSAGVAFGGVRAPFAAGAEFGAHREGHRQRKSGSYIGYRQFEPWRGADRNAGYFVYPSIRDNETRIVDQYTQAIDALIRRNFPD